jgi:hypothetical protein
MVLLVNPALSVFWEDHREFSSPSSIPFPAHENQLGTSSIMSRKRTEQENPPLGREAFE